MTPEVVIRQAVIDCLADAKRLGDESARRLRGSGMLTESATAIARIEIADAFLRELRRRGFEVVSA